MPRSIRLSRISRLTLLTLVLAACSDGASPAGSTSEPTGSVSLASTALAQVSSFGANPGNLLMFKYTPQAMPAKAPLVLALHGCTQSASDYTSAGWNALADQYKFYVVYPQQQSANNTESCFNWFGNTSGSTADITRGQGEGESIIQMIDNMESSYSIDPKQVYITGFSAGAAYAVAMLAMYPDVFAAGSSFSGLPFGCSRRPASPDTPAPTLACPSGRGRWTRRSAPRTSPTWCRSGRP
jgi:poly(hydroxyalkanoate) depolymerase family esterase